MLTWVCASESVFERSQRQRRDRVGATRWGRRRRRRSKRASEWETFVGSLQDPPWPPRCLRKRTRTRSRSRARSASELSPSGFHECMIVYRSCSPSSCSSLPEKCVMFHVHAVVLFLSECCGSPPVMLRLRLGLTKVCFQDFHSRRPVVVNPQGWWSLREMLTGPWGQVYFANTSVHQHNRWKCVCDNRRETNRIRSF